MQAVLTFPLPYRPEPSPLLFYSGEPLGGKGLKYKSKYKKVDVQITRCNISRPFVSLSGPSRTAISLWAFTYSILYKCDLIIQHVACDNIQRLNENTSQRQYKSKFCRLIVRLSYAALEINSFISTQHIRGFQRFEISLTELGKHKKKQAEYSTTIIVPFIQYSTTINC